MEAGAGETYGFPPHPPSLARHLWSRGVAGGTAVPLQAKAWNLANNTKISHALHIGDQVYIDDAYDTGMKRIADTGLDPVPMMAEAVSIIRDKPYAELIWAIPRELLNIFQADSVGCHIITVTGDLLKKLPLIGKDLNKYSLETVQMFYEDARAAGYRIIIT